MSKTKVFISSTCYDLSQIRHDLNDSINSMGHIPIMSELKDFPVNPMVSSSDNCVEVVNNEADVFILILGNRYGYKLDTGQSITNLEFEAAVKKRIPIYTFTLKKMVHVLPLWKKNPSMDFSDYVDDLKVLDFIDYVRSKSGLWNFEFEKAQDIIDILKNQLSFLLKNALSERLVLKSSIDDYVLSNMSGKSRSILIRKGEYYEARLFLQMLSDEILKYSFEKNDCEYSIIIKKNRTFLHDLVACLDWLQERLQELEHYVDMLNNLFSAFEFYYGKVGIPSDIKGLYYVANRYGEIYRLLLQWVIEAKSVMVPDDLKPLLKAFSELPLSVLSQIEEYPSSSLKVLDETIKKIHDGEIEKGTPLSLVLSVRIDESVNDKFLHEMLTIKRKLIH